MFFLIIKKGNEERLLREVPIICLPVPFLAKFGQFYGHRYPPLPAHEAENNLNLYN